MNLQAGLPFTSREVRWFFDGGASEHPALVEWFRTAMPFAQHDGSLAASWRGRLDGEPDVYLLVPGAEDMGIKWREGLLQIKGRTGVPGETRFGRQVGTVERWAKWSYAGLAPPWRDLFVAATAAEPARCAVHKQRMLRLLCIDLDADPVEMDPSTRVSRGVNAELTDVEVSGRRYLTLGFEAFPDDTLIEARFASVVETFLAELACEPLEARASQSYPAWLAALDAREP